MSALISRPLVRRLALGAGLIATVALAGEPDKNGSFPLAAAMVIQGKLYVVDVPTRELRPVDLPEGFKADEADLSPDKQRVAVNGWRADRAPARILLVELATGNAEEVQVEAQGEHRFPRFTADGKYLHFSAALAPGPGGHHNPLRLHRLSLADRKIELLPTREGKCEFSPAAAGKDRVVHVSTSCYIGFELVVSGEKDGESRVVGSVSGPRAEVAVAPDRGTIVFTTQMSDGLTFMALDPGAEKPRKLATMRRTEDRVQPRFVCPKDLVFYNDGRIWALDTEGGAMTELLEHSPMTPPKTLDSTSDTSNAPEENGDTR